MIILFKQNPLSCVLSRISILIFLLSCLNCSAIDTMAKDSPPPHSFNVGYQVLDFKYTQDGQEKVLTAAVWYPTAATPAPYTYGGPTQGNIAVDAAPLNTESGFPILFFSHGFGGSGIGGIFFTEPLAARGWIVVAPDHHDAHYAVRIRTGQLKKFSRRGLLKSAKKITESSPETRDAYLYRLDEMKITMDRILENPIFSKCIDKNKIAVGGHSLGGFTALGLCGTIKDYYDTHIKAVLLFSTGAGGYLFTEQELHNVHIPSMLLFGEHEKKSQRGDMTMAELSEKIFNNMSQPRYLLEVKGGNHFSFNNRFVKRHISKLMSGNEKEFDVIRRYGTAFLEKHVADRHDMDPILAISDPMLTRFIAE